MKSLLLGLLLLVAVVHPAMAGGARLSLAPVPYDLLVDETVLPHLSTGPLTGTWAEQVKAAGAAASVLVQYQPEKGERVILFSAYLFPAAAWDAAQKPDEPPPFGVELLRKDDMVLSAVGPFDAIYDPETPDGRNVALLAELIGKPESYSPAP